MSRIHRYAPVREIVPSGNGVEIRTDAGSGREKGLEALAGSTRTKNVRTGCGDRP